MSGVVEPVVDGTAVEVPPGDAGRFVGVVTRATSWVLDAVAINVVAIVTGLGAQLIFSIFPVSSNFASVLKPVAGAVYIVWCGTYFVVFWSWTGQTLGARTMQIRLVTANGGRIRPVRAVLRWIGMNLAMLPLFAGFAPILVGRRGFPDWLAHTDVVEARQLSLAQARRATLRRTRNSRGDPAGSAREYVQSASASSDGGVPPLGMPDDRSPRGELE